MGFVTVLTPLFNNIEYFEECYKSIVNQTCQDFIWIIGVNGHGDHTNSVYLDLKKYESDKVIVKNYETRGKVDTLNEMMKSVNTPYICLCDGDDVWFPNKLEVQKQALEMYPFIDVFSTNCQYIGELNHVPQLPYGVINYEILTKINPVVNSSVIMKRESAFWINRFNLEDYDLWFRLILDKKIIVTIPEPYIYHRIHKNSSFNSSGIQNPSALISYYEELVNDVTVVSAYYPVKSKNSVSDYLKWLEFWRFIPCKLVFFTTQDYVSVIENIRSNFKEKTKIIVLEFNELEAIKRYTYDFWSQQYSKDHETYHTPELYILWYEKKEFVKKAIDLNFFNTSKFVWCDAGICRHHEWIPQLVQFPRSDKIDSNKFNVLRITEFESESDFQKINCVGGGVLAASKQVWKDYYPKYDSMIESYIEQNKFVGKDQSIIASMIQKEPHFFNLIPIIDMFKDNGYTCWFSLLFYFS